MKRKDHKKAFWKRFSICAMFVYYFFLTQTVFRMKLIRPLSKNRAQL